jgi:ribosomal protein L21
VHHFTPSKPNLLGPNAKVLIYQVLMIRHESMINIGHPWLMGVVVKGQISHFCLGDKIIIYKMCIKK